MWFHNIRKLPFITSSTPSTPMSTTKLPKTNSRFYADSPISPCQGPQLQIPNLDKSKSSSDIDLARASALASMTPADVELEVNSLILRSSKKENGLKIIFNADRYPIALRNSLKMIRIIWSVTSIVSRSKS